MPAVIDCNRKLDVTATINRRTFQLNKRNHKIVRRDKRNLENPGVIALESAGSLAGGERKRTLGRSRKQEAEGSRRNKADLPTAFCLLLLLPGGLLRSTRTNYLSPRWGGVPIRSLLN